MDLAKNALPKIGMIALDPCNYGEGRKLEPILKGIGFSKVLPLESRVNIKPEINLRKPCLVLFDKTIESIVRPALDGSSVEKAMFPIRPLAIVRLSEEKNTPLYNMINGIINPDVYEIFSRKNVIAESGTILFEIMDALMKGKSNMVFVSNRIPDKMSIPIERFLSQSGKDFVVFTNVNFLG